MSVKREFTCNLCGNGIHPSGEAEGFLKGGVGVWFVAGDAIDFRAVTDTERHLCEKCIVAIVSAGLPERMGYQFSGE